MPIWVASLAARLRAALFGQELSLAIASWTAARVVSRTFFSPLMTRETVIADTPAAAATSSIVIVPRLRRLGLPIRSLSRRIGHKAATVRLQMAAAVDPAGGRGLCRVS